MRHGTRGGEPVRSRLFVFTILLASAGLAAAAQEGAPPDAEKPADDMAELTRKLNNPVASLISVPFQSNFDFGGGPEDDGFQYKLNIQPVIPFGVTKNWK